MSDLATVQIEQLRSIPLAHVVGEVDASNAASIQARIIDAVGNEGVGLVIDLTATAYLDSAGIRALFAIGQRLQMRGMELRLVAAPESFVADVLKTVQIAEHHAVDYGVQAAVAVLIERLPRERTPE